MQTFLTLVKVSQHLFPSFNLIIYNKFIFFVIKYCKQLLKIKVGNPFVYCYLKFNFSNENVDI